MKKWKHLTLEFLNSKRARLDAKTVAWYRMRMKTWVEFAGRRRLKPRRVSVADLDIFFGELKSSGLKFSTRRGQLTATKLFFKWLRKRRYIKQNPFDEFEPLTQERDTVIEPIPLSFAYRMIRAAEATATPYGVRDAAIMRLLLTTGARREEVATLRLDCLNLDAQSVVLIGKFGHRRLVPLRLTTVAAMRRWLEQRPQTTCAAVFVSLHPNRSQQIYEALRPNAINDILIKWRDLAGLPQVSVSPHKWRHRFASEMKKAGDPFSLKVLMGHSDIATTQRYVHSSPEELAAMVLRWGPDMPE